jgi:hypothetical protein
MCLTVNWLPRYNPPIAKAISIFKSRRAQLLVAVPGAGLLLLFLAVHTLKDFQAEVSAWYFHSTLVWLLVMLIASLIFLWKVRQLKAAGKDVKTAFKELPE